MNRLLILFLLFSINSFSQEHITFNLGTGAALNYNQPIYKLKNDKLKPILFNGSLSLLGNIKLDFKEHAFLVEGIYHFRKYGSKLKNTNAIAYSKAFIETTTFNIKYHRFLKNLKKLNSKVFLTTSIGYSITSLSSENGRVHGIEGEPSSGDTQHVWNSNFDESKPFAHTTNAGIGLNFSTQFKNKKKFDYGFNYNYEFEAMPKHSSKIISNEKEYETSFETQPHYLLFYFTASIFHFENS